MKFIRRYLNGLLGLAAAISVNARCIAQRLAGKRIVIFQLHGASQLPHIESLLSAMQSQAKVYCLILTPPKEIDATRQAIAEKFSKAISVRSYDSSWFLICWHAVIGVDQGMRLPMFNCLRGHRICLFHGQPSKGNTYHQFNARGYDDLFFYGDFMKGRYLTELAKHPHWQHQTHDIGQPKSDVLFELDLAEQRQRARATLSLESGDVVLYAPSFEASASLAQRGEAIIAALQEVASNLIVKPHPSFFRVVNEDDSQYFGVPHAGQWQDKAAQFCQRPGVKFPTRNQIPAEVALAAADVVVTDHSGIAFDAILLDIPVIYIHCPEFFFQHLPKTYGIDGEQAVNDLACNAGRAAGTVVESLKELKAAVSEALAQPTLNQEQRQAIKQQLLFNPGNATMVATKTILQLIQLDK